MIYLDFSDKFHTFAGLNLKFHTFFKKLINVFRQMNYSKFQSEEFKSYETEIEELLTEKVQA